MDDRPSLFDDRPALSENLTDDVVEYRAISPLAIVGAVFGLASPLALVSGFLAPLPLLGAVISWFAAQGIRKQAEAKSGLGVALFGLVLSLLVLGAVWVRGPLVQRLHASTAEPIVERFLKAVAEGEYATAHQLTMPFTDRRPTPADASVYYSANTEAQVELAKFQAKPEIERLAKAAPVFVTHSAAAPSGPGAITIRWLYRLPAVDGEPELGLTVTTVRRPYGGRGVWRIARVEYAAVKG